jgi:internalin A
VSNSDAVQKGVLIVIWKALSALAILSLCLGNAAAQEKAKPPEPISEKEWPAWVTAGGTIGFLSEFVPGLVRFELRDRAGAGYLPAFRFDDWPPKQKLSALPAITVPFGLDFHGLKVMDADVKELARLKNLRFLRLNGTKVTDAGLKQLAGLSDLQALDLGSTQVSDTGLKELGGLKNLRLLLLDGTKVTDEGLKELTSLKSLRSVNLRKTGVTKEGVAQLKKALPACRIVPDK